MTTHTCVVVDGAAGTCSGRPTDTSLFVVLVGAGLLAMAFGGRTLWRAG